MSIDCRCNQSVICSCSFQSRLSVANICLVVLRIRELDVMTMNMSQLVQLKPARAPSASPEGDKFGFSQSQYPSMYCEWPARVIEGKIITGKAGTHSILDFA